MAERSPMKADKDGFLVGTPYPMNKGSAGRAVGILQSIKSDTAALVRAVRVGEQRARGVAAQPNRRPQAILSSAQVATLARAVSTRQSGLLPARDAQGRFVAAGGGNGGGNGVAKAPAQAVTPSANRTRKVGQPAPGETPERDAGGRFKGSGAGAGNGWGFRWPFGGKGGDKGEIASAIKDGLSAAGEDVDKLDPAVEAAKETKQIAENVGGLLKGGLGLARGVAGLGVRGFNAGKRLIGKDADKSIPLQKRILKELKDLNGKQGEEGGGGIMGLLMSVGPFIMGLLPMVLAGLAVAGAGMIGKAIGDWLYSAIQPYFLAGLDKFFAAGEWIRKTWDNLTASFEQKVVLPMQAMWQGLKAKFEKFLGPIVETKNRVADSVSEGASVALDRAKSLFGGGSAGNKKALEAQATAAGITDPRERAMFMAQMDHESGGFRKMEESFSYRDPNRIMNVSATARRAGPEAVKAAMAKGPEAVAELMYGGRMGNNAPGDAYKYRGRGFTQLTGKDQYAEASKALGMDLVNNPDLAADPEVAAKVSTWYWKKSGAGAKARAGDLSGSRKAVNGGLNGMGDVNAKYAAYLSESGSMAPSAAAVAPAATSVPRTATAAVAPQVAKMTPPPRPDIDTPVASNAGKGGDTTVVTVRAPVSQNVGDRSIAQVATGGIGTSGRA